MKVLIAFYHKNILENMIAVIGLQPDILMYFFDRDSFSATALCDTYTVCGRYVPNLKLETGTCDFMNLVQIEKKLGQYLQENQDDEQIIDLTGANGLAAVAAQRLAGKYQAVMVMADIRRGRIYRVDQKQSRCPAQRFGITDVIEAAGGCVRGCTDSRYLDQNRERFFHTAALFLKKNPVWSRLCALFQKNNGYCDGDEGLDFHAKESSGQVLESYLPLLKQMQSGKLIHGLQIGRDRIRFTYADEQIKKLLANYGVWLELFIYYTLEETGQFYDVRNSLKVDWDRDDGVDWIENELDVTAMYGWVPVVVSCKMSDVAPGASVINELYTVSRRASRGHVIRILVTDSRMRRISPYNYRKAKEMGILVMDHEDLCREDFAKELTQAICRQPGVIR